MVERSGGAGRACAEETKRSAVGGTRAHLPQELGGRVIPGRTGSYDGEERPGPATHVCPGLDPLSLRAETRDARRLSGSAGPSPLRSALQDHRRDPAPARGRGLPARVSRARPTDPPPTPRGSHCLTLLLTPHKKPCSKEPGHHHARASGCGSGCRT